MRASEIFLRIGSVLAAWMMIYAYFIWLAVVGRVSCGSNGDEVFRLLLGVAPLAVGASFVLGAARPFPDIHKMLRWLSIPCLALLYLTLPVIYEVFAQVNMNKEPVCATVAPSAWHAWWAPIQFLVTSLCVFQLMRNWRTATE